MSSPTKTGSKFRVRSEFGTGRQRGSRRSRPCDVCRKRKTACVMTLGPPCTFCKSKDITCESTRASPPARPRTSPQIRNNRPTSVVEAGDLPVTTRLSPSITPTNTIRSIDPSVAVHSPGEAAKTQRESVNTTVYTLDDGLNLTAHSMGIAGEQDTHVLGLFRTVVVDETHRIHNDMLQVSPGDLANGLPPVHFTIISDEFMPYDNKIKEDASSMIGNLVGSHESCLVRLYFQHIHPIYSVVSKVRFLKAYKSQKSLLPASLRGVMYGLASVFWDQDPVVKTIPRPFEPHELFSAARASLERELDGPNLWTMQACLLIVHETAPSFWTFETPRTWTLSAQAVACAQEIGLHRECGLWNIAPWEKSLRKKLWWATYILDTWSSITSGNPPHIHDSACTTSDLVIADVLADEDVPADLVHVAGTTDSAAIKITMAARFVELARLTRFTHALLEHAFTDKSLQAQLSDPHDCESQLLRIRADLDSWHSLLPQCLTMYAECGSGNGRLHLAYYATRILLFRALMTPATKAAKNNANSTLRRHFHDAVKEGTIARDFIRGLQMNNVQHVFWGRHARPQFVLLGNFIISLFLLSSNLEEVQMTYNLLESLHESLRSLGSLKDHETESMFRPVALRVKSFLTYAAQVMRDGSAVKSLAMEHMVALSP